MIKLVEFIVTEESSEQYNCSFIVNGDYEISSDFCGNQYLEFYETEAMKMLDGIYERYIPKGHTWVGHAYTAEDIITDVLACESRGGQRYRLLYCEPGLKGLLEYYRKDTIKIDNNIEVPKRIFGSDNDVYELLNATEKFLYYTNDTKTIMLSLQTRNLISDNYFAELGWYDSMTAIITGKEKLLYGTVPKDFEAEQWKE